MVIYTKLYNRTGWPKSNVPKARAHCSASDHLICEFFSGVFRDIQWIEEYLKIIEIDVHFFLNERSFCTFLTPLTCLVAWITSPLGYFCLAH